MASWSLYPHPVARRFLAHCFVRPGAAAPHKRDLLRGSRPSGAEGLYLGSFPFVKKICSLLNSTAKRSKVLKSVLVSFIHTNNPWVCLYRCGLCIHKGCPNNSLGPGRTIAKVHIPCHSRKKQAGEETALFSGAGLGSKVVSRKGCTFLGI